MTESSLAIIETKETIYFSREEGWLRQWMQVTVESRLDRPAAGTITIKAAGDEVTTRVEIMPGVRQYRAYAPTLWPDHARISDAGVWVQARNCTASARTTVGTHRPWKVYLLSDACTDYVWMYEEEAACRADDAAVTAAELEQVEATASAPEADRNHYNMVVAREVEFFLERYPDQAERLFDCIRRGDVVLNPIFNMCLTQNVGLEELIRNLYAARNWAHQHDLPIAYANLQETPTMTWATAMVLSGCGIGHLIKSVLPYECPWAKRLQEPPIFCWEGPDGSRVLVRRRNEDYVEGRFVLRDLRAVNTALNDQIVPRYEALGSSYPYDAIAVVGCYGDMAAQTRNLPARKSANVAAYNAQSWEYPKLVNASHQQFWEDVEAQIASRQIEVPVVRGEWGSSWEAWTASLAREFAGWRRAQERASVADRIAAIVSLLEPGCYAGQRSELARGWTNLTYLADHAWNGATNGNIELNERLRREWQSTANQAFDRVIATGLVSLSRRIHSEQGRSVAVFNSLSWARSGVIALQGVDPTTHIVDLLSGEEVPAQAVIDDGHLTLWFQASQVPSVGYRAYTLVPGEEPLRDPGPWTWSNNRLDGPFYAVEVSPVTGGIVSLYDKTRDKELVDPASPYHVNQCLYLSEGIEHTPRHAQVTLGACGPVFAQIIVRAALKNIQLTSTITLYAAQDRVEIRNEVEKLPTCEKQELDFAFPLNVPHHRCRYEVPGAIIAPETDLRSGAGLAALVVRHFVDLFNEEFGVTFSQADSGVVEFGHRTTTEDPPKLDQSNSTILAMALGNYLDWNEANRHQGGATRFVFRYSLRGHGAGFDPVAAVHFGWEDNNELLPIPLPSEQQGSLPGTAHSFIEASPANAILTCLKVAEEEGLVLRLWKCSKQETRAQVTVRGLGSLKEARLTDLLERDLQGLSVEGQFVSVPLPACGVSTVRLLLDASSLANGV